MYQSSSASPLLALLTSTDDVTSAKAISAATLARISSRFASSLGKDEANPSGSLLASADARGVITSSASVRSSARSRPARKPVARRPRRVISRTVAGVDANVVLGDIAGPKPRFALAFTLQIEANHDLAIVKA